MRKDVSWIQWLKKLKSNNKELYGETESEFLQYQSFARWMRKYHAQYNNDAVFEKYFVQSCVNFNGIMDNLILFISGFIRSIGVIVPNDVMQFCIHWLYDQSLNLLDEDDAFYREIRVGRHEVYDIRAICARSVEFIDEWIVWHESMEGDILMTNLGQRVTKMDENYNYSMFKEIKIGGKYGVNCIRKVWKIRVTHAQMSKIGG